MQIVAGLSTLARYQHAALRGAGEPPEHMPPGPPRENLSGAFGDLLAVLENKLIESAGGLRLGLNIEGSCGVVPGHGQIQVQALKSSLRRACLPAICNNAVVSQALAMNMLQPACAAQFDLTE